MNRTTFLRNMHQRADAILEMIERSDRRAQDAARWVIHYKNNPQPWNQFTLPIEEKRLEKYINISYRLQKYYADVMVRMTKPVIEKMVSNVRQIGDIKTMKPLSADHVCQILNLNS